MSTSFFDTIDDETIIAHRSSQRLLVAMPETTAAFAVDQRLKDEFGGSVSLGELICEAKIADRPIYYLTGQAVWNACPEI